MYVGNFKKLCKLHSKYDDNFSIIFKQKTNYTSWIVQNEILKICATFIIDSILEEIKDSGLYAIMCDEARSLHF